MGTDRVKNMMNSNAPSGAGPQFCSGMPDDETREHLMKNPRYRFIEAVRKNDAATCLVKTAEIHGHFCPGSALDVIASLYGLRMLGEEGTNADGIMENLIAIVEINACFTDGIQAVSGCTLGNNALIYRDLGRHAVTFAVRGRERCIRVRVLPAFKNCINKAVFGFFPLMEKVILKREGTTENLIYFREMGRKAAFALLQLPPETFLAAQVVVPEIPPYAPLSDTVICPGCSEQIMVTKVQRTGPHKGKCFMCSGEYFEVEGRGIVRKNPFGRKMPRGHTGRRRNG